jgi:sarcosine oxidase subunit gamma
MAEPPAPETFATATAATPTADRRAPVFPTAAWLEPVAPAARFAFYGGGAARAAAAAHWAPSFSEVACRATVHAERASLWLGPDEYLLMDFAPAAPEQATLEDLERALAGLPHALVDISHRQVALRIRGPEAELILRGACPLDLDGGAFPVGMCTRTVLAKAQIVLWRTREDTFHLEVWRSFAGYVAGVLAEIATEFLPTP